MNRQVFFLVLLAGLSLGLSGCVAPVEEEVASAVYEPACEPFDAACCSGCWAGDACREKPDALACGANGGLCVPCNGTSVCELGRCVLPH